MWPSCLHCRVTRPGEQENGGRNSRDKGRDEGQHGARDSKGEAVLACARLAVCVDGVYGHEHGATVTVAAAAPCDNRVCNKQGVMPHAISHIAHKT
jgi:hypothetical protein